MKNKLAGMRGWAESKDWQGVRRRKVVIGQQSREPRMTVQRLGKERVVTGCYN